MSSLQVLYHYRHTLKTLEQTLTSLIDFGEQYPEINREADFVYFTTGKDFHLLDAVYGKIPVVLVMKGEFFLVYLQSKGRYKLAERHVVQNPMREIMKLLHTEGLVFPPWILPGCLEGLTFHRRDIQESIQMLESRITSQRASSGLEPDL